MTPTDENDVPLCRCGHSAYVHARVPRGPVPYYPCRQVLPVDLRADQRERAEPPPCPCDDYRRAE